MSEIITNETFNAHVSQLGLDEVAHHSMIYSSIYPADREVHKLSKQRIPFDTSGGIFEAAATAVGNGARLEWLGVLPEIGGDTGLDKKDLDAVRFTMSVIASKGFVMRAIEAREAARIADGFGDSSPIALDYKRGVELGVPRKSSWSLYQRPAGALALTYLDLMDYDYATGKFIGRQAQDPAADTEAVEWALAWREAYETIAVKID